MPAPAASLDGKPSRKGLQSNMRSSTATVEEHMLLGNPRQTGSATKICKESLLTLPPIVTRPTVTMPSGATADIDHQSGYVDSVPMFQKTYQAGPRHII